MAIFEDLIFFLKNGKFENIDFGITRNQLVEISGEPDFTLPEKSKMPTLFKYDIVEFYFEDKSENAKLKEIQINYPYSYSEKGNLRFENYDWTTKLTIEEAKAFLNTNKIKFKEIPEPNNLDFWRLLQTESGVQVYFTNQRAENVWELYSFGSST